MSNIDEQIKANEKSIAELREQLNEVYTLREALKETLTGYFPASRRTVRRIERSLIELSIGIVTNCNSILRMLKQKPCTCNTKKGTSKSKDVMIQ